MADVSIEISRTSVKFIAWLRTSYIGLSIVSEDGVSMIEEIELGPDQENAFDDFFTEAMYEVAKIFMSRQGDVEGEPFVKEGDGITYKFKEAEPYLTQASILKSTLNEDVKNAVYAYVVYLWLLLKGNVAKASELMGKYQKLAIDIQGNIHRLHD